MSDMPRPRPPHLHREETRHGTVNWYVRRGHGPRVRMRAEFGTPEFWGEYRAAIEAAPPPEVGVKPNTLRWTVDRYRASSEWAALSNATRRQREYIYRTVIKAAGDQHIATITEAKIHEGRERRAATPHAANNFLKAMRALFAWAVEHKLVKTNPSVGIKKLRGDKDAAGFHTWSEEEVARFEERWPLGTRERLAFDLMLYTGLRRGDAVRLGRQHVRDGVLTLRSEKTGRLVVLPLLAPLAESIATAKTGDLTFLVTETGSAFSKQGFGNWFRRVCTKAGCPGSAHGLRKAGATRAAENGATERQLMAMFDWSSPKMAAHYTRAADRKRLAKDAGGMMLSIRKVNAELPHPGPAPSRTFRKRKRIKTL